MDTGIPLFFSEIEYLLLETIPLKTIMCVVNCIDSLLLTKSGTWIFGPSFKLSKSLETYKIKIEWFMTNLLCFFKVSMVQPWPLYPAPDLHGGFRFLIRLHAPQEVHVQVLGTLTYSWNRSFLQNVSERLELATCLFQWKDGKKIAGSHFCETLSIL